MAKRLIARNSKGGTTDHTEEIHALREIWFSCPDPANPTDDAIAAGAVASLLEVHDDTGISLDNWYPVNTFVDTVLAKHGLPGYLPNGA